jgi:predicted ATPase
MIGKFHMAQDRITRLRISGMRAIESLDLELRGLTVLIGDNGTGKSTILDALQILRLATQTGAGVVPDLLNPRGGLQGLVRRGESELTLGLSVEGAGPRLDYDFTVGAVGTGLAIRRESLFAHEDKGRRPVLHRDEGSAKLFDEANGRQARDLHDLAVAGELQLVDRSMLVLPTFRGSVRPELQRLGNALSNMQVHVPFEVRPTWQQEELRMTRVGPRWPAQVEPTSRLARYGLNLPNAFQEIRNIGTDNWRRVIDMARLGLGGEVQDLVPAPAGRGTIELQVSYGPDKLYPLEMLSDGQVSFLCFLALCELGQGRSLLAFDEPEVHLHPALLARVFH